MKLYPMERCGNISYYAKTTDFKGLRTFNADKGGISFNKAERKMMKSIGWNLDKDDMEEGALWLEKQDIKSISNSLSNLKDLNEKEEVIVNELVKFFDICLSKGYGVRVY